MSEEDGSDQASILAEPTSRTPAAITGKIRGIIGKLVLLTGIDPLKSESLALARVLSVPIKRNAVSRLYDH